MGNKQADSMKRRLLPKRALGLQGRITISYVLTTLLVVLLVEFVFGTLLWIIINFGPFTFAAFTKSARQAAELLALASAAQASNVALNPETTFQPGRPASISLPDNDFPDNAVIHYVDPHTHAQQILSFALLITRTNSVLASSYPARYPISSSITRLPLRVNDAIRAAISGDSTSGVDPATDIYYAAAPVWSQKGHILGVVVVCLQTPTQSPFVIFQGIALLWLASSVFWLVMLLPACALFGWFTTRRLLSRLRKLAQATTRFAQGDYRQRVLVSRRDEVGQLEEQFNSMVEQLLENISLRQLLAAQNARLAERARIARDLHDSVKQQVFAISMQISTALALLDGQHKAVQQHMQEAEMLVYNVQQEFTLLIHELRPLALQDRGLAVALREYVSAWSRQQNIEVEVSIAENLPLSTPIEEALWRVAQEVLSNSARHSHATHVQVTLTFDMGAIELSIVDNGCGFDPHTIHSSGIGLHSMQERMYALGGAITIESKAGAGTRILARVPVAYVAASVESKYVYDK